MTHDEQRALAREKIQERLQAAAHRLVEDVDALPHGQPQTLHRIELRAVGRQKDQHYVLGHHYVTGNVNWCVIEYDHV